nr:MAG TPA: CI repressor [Caudoviricetes sp.]
MMKTFSSKEVVDRLKKALSLSTDNSLAEYLGISKATLSNWKSRNTIDFLLVFSKCEHLNMDWLLMGRGEMEIGEHTLNLDTENSGINQDWIQKALEQAEEIGRLKEKIRVLEAELGNKNGIANILEGLLEEASSTSSGAVKVG